MSAPAHSLARGDAVLWQWPTGPREWLRAGMWVWSGRSVALVWVVVGMAVSSAILSSNYLRQQVPANADAELMQMVLAILALTVLFGAPMAVMTGIGCLLVPRLTLTARTVRMATRFPWLQGKTVPQSDIRSVVIYEGDGTVVLLGEDSEILRARHVTRATAFAEALDAPTVAWPVRTGGDRRLWTLYLALWLAVVSVPMFFVAMYPAAYLVYGFVFLLSHMADISGFSGGALFVFFILPLTAAITTILALPLALFLGVAAGRFLFKPETLHGFIHAMCRTPHWDGCAPPSRPGRRPRPATCYTAWCARLVGIPPPPEPRPDSRHGATPEMVLSALPMA